MTGRLKTFVVADPELPVPPLLYGGIERVIALLVDGLTERGHDVTLFANAESHVRCRLVPLQGERSESKADTVRNALAIGAAVASQQPDIVHSFGRLAYLMAILPTRVPKVMSYQRVITRRSVVRSLKVARGSL